MILAAHLVCAAGGVALMAAPDVLGYDGPARLAHLIAGPLIVAASIVAIWPATAPVRWAVVPIGLVLVVGAVGFGGGIGAQATGLVGGAFVAALTFITGDRPDTALMGGGWRALVRKDDMS